MIVGITMVKDEADIIEYTMAHMLTQVDVVYALDNNSIDGTGAILDAMERVVVLYDPEVAYRQADKLTNLAHKAAAEGATWIVPFDADEAWFLPDLRVEPVDVVIGVQYIFVPTPCDDANEGNPLRRIRWRYAQPDDHRKVAFRYRPDVSLSMGNHDVIHPGSRAEKATIRHFMYRSFEQMQRKVANGLEAYLAAPDLMQQHGSHWFYLAGLTPEQQAKWWEDYICDPSLVFDEWMPW